MLKQMVAVSLFLSYVSSHASLPERNSVFECPTNSHNTVNSLVFDPDGRVLWRRAIFWSANTSGLRPIDLYLTATSKESVVTFKWEDKMSFTGNYIGNEDPKLQVLYIPFLNGKCKRVDTPSTRPLPPLTPVEGSPEISARGSCEKIANDDALNRYQSDTGCSDQYVRINRAVRHIENNENAITSILAAGFLCAVQNTRYVYQILSDSVDDSKVCTLKLLGTRP